MQQKNKPIIIDKKSTYIAPDVQFGKNVIIYSGNHIEAGTIIKDNVTLLPNNYIENSVIGRGSKIHASVIEQSHIEERCLIGPYSHLRAGAHLKNNVHVGNFCEIKNSTIGEGTKINHLAYVGDTDIGKNCNIGCGAIFVNYNGKIKARSLVADNCFIGSNVNIIAPVVLGEGTYVCAGTTLDTSTLADDFVIARPQPTIKHNYTKNFLDIKPC